MNKLELNWVNSILGSNHQPAVEYDLAKTIFYSTSDSSTQTFGLDSNKIVSNSNGILIYSEDILTISAKDVKVLTSIQLPILLESLPDYGFSNCNQLTELSVPLGTKTIGKNVFYNCKGIKTLSIPDSITTFGANVFCNMTALTDLYFGIYDLTNVTFGSSPFSGTSKSKVTIHCPDGTSSSYSAHSTLKGCLAYVEDVYALQSFSRSQPNYNEPFMYWLYENYPTQCTASDRLTYAKAAQCTAVFSSLTRVIESKTRIVTLDELRYFTKSSNVIFYGAPKIPKLKSVSIPSQIQSLWGNTFFEDGELTRVIGLDRTLEGVIRGSAFHKCSNLKLQKLSALSLASDGTSNGIFYQCTSLLSPFTWDCNVVPQNTFYNCTVDTIKVTNRCTALSGRSFASFKGNNIYLPFTSLEGMTVDDDCFLYTRSGLVIHIPSGSRSEYEKVTAFNNLTLVEDNN